MATDLVCGTTGIAEEGYELSSEYLGKTYYFCSEECQEEFESDPDFYAVLD